MLLPKAVHSNRVPNKLRDVYVLGIFSDILTVCQSMSLCSNRINNIDRTCMSKKNLAWSLQLFAQNQAWHSESKAIVHHWPIVHINLLDCRMCRIGTTFSNSLEKKIYKFDYVTRQLIDCETFESNELGTWTCIPKWTLLACRPISELCRKKIFRY
jgi:hypothetical protein